MKKRAESPIPTKVTEITTRLKNSKNISLVILYTISSKFTSINDIFLEFLSNQKLKLLHIRMKKFFICFYIYFLSTYERM